MDHASLQDLVLELQQRGWLIRQTGSSASDATFSSVAFLPADVQPGALYIEDLTGLSAIGESHFDKAWQRGAVAVAGETPGDNNAKSPCLQIHDPRAVVALASALLYQQPARNLKLHGITGTVGKTSTTAMFARCLDAADLLAGAWTSCIAMAGNACERTFLTTPQAPMLQKFLAACRDTKRGHVALEFSSHAGADKRIGELVFQSAILTNLSRDHLEFHGGWEGYINAKAQLFRQLAPEGVAVIPSNEPDALKVCQHSNSVTFGVDSKADAFALPDRIEIRGALAERLSAKPFTLAAGTPPGGRFQQINAAAAAAAALLAGVEPAHVEMALQTFPGLPQRQEIIYRGSFTIFDDYAPNPAALNGLLDQLRGAPPQKVTLFWRLRGFRGPQLNKECGEKIAEIVRTFRPLHVIVSRTTDFEAATASVEEMAAFIEGYGSASPQPIFIDDHNEALDRALALVRRGGNLLLLNREHGETDRLEELIARRDHGWFSKCRSRHFIAEDPVRRAAQALRLKR